MRKTKKKLWSRCLIRAGSPVKSTAVGNWWTVGTSQPTNVTHNTQYTTHNNTTHNAQQHSIHNNTTVGTSQPTNVTLPRTKVEHTIRNKVECVSATRAKKVRHMLYNDTEFVQFSTIYENDLLTDVDRTRRVPREKGGRLSSTVLWSGCSEYKTVQLQLNWSSSTPFQTIQWQLLEQFRFQKVSHVSRIWKESANRAHTEAMFLKHLRKVFFNV